MSFAVVLSPLLVALLLLNCWVIPSFHAFKSLRVWYLKLVVSVGVYILYAMVTRVILRWKTPALIVPAKGNSGIQCQQPNTSSKESGNQNPTHLIIIQHGYCYNYAMQAAVQRWLAEVYHCHSQTKKKQKTPNPSDTLNSKSTRLINKEEEESDQQTREECVMIHVARSQSDEWTFGLWNTHDGVYKQGQRLKQEITEIISNNPSITDISLIGMSLGGLMIRKVAQLMFHDDQNLTVKIGIYNRKKSLNGRMFITMATPHLGCDDWIRPGHYRCSWMFQMWRISRFLRSIHMLPLTLVHLLNLDSTLTVMANDPEHLDALRCFDQLWLYSNVRGDTRVSCCSAAILPESHDTEQYWTDPRPCDIIEFDSSTLRERQQQPIADQSNSTVMNETLPLLMTDLPWRRMIVSMNHNWFAQYLSHTVITILNPQWDSAQEVLDHLATVVLSS